MTRIDLTNPGKIRSLFKTVQLRRSDTLPSVTESELKSVEKMIAAALSRDKNSSYNLCWDFASRTVNVLIVTSNKGLDATRKLCMQVALRAGCSINTYFIRAPEELHLSVRQALSAAHTLGEIPFVKIQIKDGKIELARNSKATNETSEALKIEAALRKVYGENSLTCNRGDPTRISIAAPHARFDFAGSEIRELESIGSPAEPMSRRISASLKECGCEVAPVPEDRIVALKTEIEQLLTSNGIKTRSISFDGDTLRVIIHESPFRLEKNAWELLTMLGSIDQKIGPNKDIQVVINWSLPLEHLTAEARGVLNTDKLSLQRDVHDSSIRLSVSIDEISVKKAIRVVDALEEASGVKVCLNILPSCKRKEERDGRCSKERYQHELLFSLLPRVLPWRVTKNDQGSVRVEVLRLDNFEPERTKDKFYDLTGVRLEIVGNAELLGDAIPESAYLLQSSIWESPDLAQAQEELIAIATLIAADLGSVNIARLGSVIVITHSVKDLPRTFVTNFEKSLLGYRSAVMFIYSPSASTSGINRLGIAMRSLPEGIYFARAESDTRLFVRALNPDKISATVLELSSLFERDITITNLAMEEPLAEALRNASPEWAIVLARLSDKNGVIVDLQKVDGVFAEAHAFDEMRSAPDFSHLPCNRDVQPFTIDTYGTKIFEDAFSVETLPNGDVRIGVHLTSLPDGFSIYDIVGRFLLSHPLSYNDGPLRRGTIPRDLLAKISLSTREPRPVISTYTTVRMKPDGGVEVLTRDYALERIQLQRSYFYNDEAPQTELPLDRDIKAFAGIVSRWAASRLLFSDTAVDALRRLTNHAILMNADTLTKQLREARVALAYSRPPRILEADLERVHSFLKDLGFSLAEGKELNLRNLEHLVEHAAQQHPDLIPWRIAMFNSGRSVHRVLNQVQRHRELVDRECLSRQELTVLTGQVDIYSSRRLRTEREYQMMDQMRDFIGSIGVLTLGGYKARSNAAPDYVLVRSNGDLRRINIGSIDAQQQELKLYGYSVVIGAPVFGE